ncbi:MAG TPA: hypothetical protein VK324_02320, partial [Tepidisphaeraceae bacterium]|nr:hypothetical protein [Tepidisphaeraceae bacterium]
MSGSTMTRFAEALEPRRLLTSIVPVSGGGYLVGYAGWTDATRGVDLFVERFDATGRPDKSFGGTPDGIAKLDFGAAETFSDLAVLPDGTIAVLGSDSFQSDAAYFAHLDADGKGLSYLGQHTFPEGSAALAVTDGGRVYLGGRSLHVRRLAKDRPPDSQLPPFSPAPPTDPTFGLAGVFDPLLPVGRTMPFNYVAGVTAVADGGVLAALAPNDYPRNP